MREAGGADGEDAPPELLGNPDGRIDHLPKVRARRGSGRAVGSGSDGHHATLARRVVVEDAVLFAVVVSSGRLMTRGHPLSSC